MLQHIDQFAKDHKIRWGQEKCRVMRVGKHTKGEVETWKIGDMQMLETATYKYLGDISNDGKNAKNIEARKNKIDASSLNQNDRCK